MSVLTYEKNCVWFYLTKNQNFLVVDLSGEFIATSQARRCVLIIFRIISDIFYASPLTVTCQLKHKVGDDIRTTVDEKMDSANMNG